MNLPFKYRGLAWLGLLFCILPWCIWHFALSSTFKIWHDCIRMKHLAEQVSAASDMSLNMTASIQKDIPELILSGGVLDSLRRLSSNRDIHIAAYYPVVTMSLESAAVHSAQMTLTGRYVDLLQVVFQLGQELPNCRFRAMNWCTTINPRTRCQQLELTLYIQQLILTGPAPSRSAITQSN